MKWLLVLLSLPCFAQIQSTKFHYGDDLRWADPKFDDSGWIDGNTHIDIHAHLLETWSWVRCKVRVPDRSLDPVIGLVNVPTVEVYLEGQMIGGSGRLPPRLQDAPFGYRVWPIPASLAVPGRVVTVAFRIWQMPGRDLRRLGRVAAAPIILLHNLGEKPLYEQRQTLALVGREWVLAVTFILVLFLFLGGRAQGTRTEFRLLTAYLLIYLASHVIFVCGFFLPFGNRLLVFTALSYPFVYSLQLELAAHFANVRPAWWLRTTQVLNFLIGVPVGLAGLLISSPPWLPAFGLAYSWVSALNLIVAILIVTLQRTDKFAPRLLPLGLVVVFLSNAARLRPALNNFTIGNASFSLTLLGNIFFSAVLVTVFLYRLRLASETASKLQTQFAAARSVQEMLLTGSARTTPGYRIDPVYRPAEEVGGDFFRILSVPGDRTLLVTGDVSGKGLKAAMLVSVLMGALLNRRSSEPAEVLSELNNAIHGQMEGGFVTCCAALLMPDGAVKISNAGHLPPYRNKTEIHLPSELPLGIVSQTSYLTVDVRLEPNERLTFLSDGVVEAENSHGELFGFDRAREISRQTAANIADAAQAFGQTDDITVITLERVA